MNTTDQRALPDEFMPFTSNGRPWQLHVASGRLLPVISGADEGEGEGGEGGSGGEGEGGEGDKGDKKTFDQAHVDKIASRARADAKKAATKELAEQLGMTPDEAKALIDANRKADSDKKSETDKALEEANAAKTAAAADKAEAASERLAAKIERRLAAAGVDDKAIARAVRLLDVDVDADNEAIDDEIEQLRTDVPGLFAAVEGEGGRPPNPPAPSGSTKPKPPAGGQAVQTALEKGAEMARKRHPQPAKQ